LRFVVNGNKELNARFSEQYKWEMLKTREDFMSKSTFASMRKTLVLGLCTIIAAIAYRMFNF
jgi:hypothetical protein